MKKDLLLNSLKKAMRAELDSVTLYSNALKKAEDKQIVDFLKDRVEEEKRHYNYLLIYYKDIEQNKKILDITGEVKSHSESKSEIISDEFIRRIGSEPELFSAISTAVLLEKNSLEYYKEMSEKVDDPSLKSFFNQMAHWETQHYIDVLHIQKEAERYFWEINKFEPF